MKRRRGTKLRILPWYCEGLDEIAESNSDESNIHAANKIQKAIATVWRRGEGGEYITAAVSLRKRAAVARRTEKTAQLTV
jgi:hypothetical protein